MDTKTIKEEIKNQALGVISDVITYYNRYDLDFDIDGVDWRENIIQDMQRFLNSQLFSLLKEVEKMKRCEEIDEVLNLIKSKIE